jgi:hypothetical protein
MKRQRRGGKKERFIRRFRKRFLLRFHMSLILIATCLSGALFSKLLLVLSVRAPLIRYPLTATLSYFLFFLFIKLWFYYWSAEGCRYRRRRDRGGRWGGFCEIPVAGPIEFNFAFIG